MTDSDFTIGFKQGQEHGIQIMQEKIEEIKLEIDKQTEIHSDGEFYIKNIDVKRIIDNHIGEVSE